LACTLAGIDTPKSKSFLVLFFKKEHLYAASFAPRARSPNNSSIESRQVPIGSPAAKTSMLLAQRIHWKAPKTV
jgi:hypothetical protein